MTPSDQVARPALARLRCLRCRAVHIIPLVLVSRIARDPLEVAVPGLIPVRLTMDPGDHVFTSAWLQAHVGPVVAVRA